MTPVLFAWSKGPAFLLLPGSPALSLAARDPKPLILHGGVPWKHVGFSSSSWFRYSSVLLAVGRAQAQGQIGAGTDPAGITPAAVQATLGSTFTYQGQLIQGGTPVNDKCDFRFTLYDAATSGSPVGPVEEKVWVRVIGGLFTVSDLDFGASVFVGQQRWLQVEVRCPPTIGSYTIVGDRQELTATPYALYAIASGSAPWLGLTGVPTGFADGVDNDTTYTAGAGLTLTGGAFAANTAYLQRRVTGVCAAGSSIRAVNDDGTVTCETDDMGWSLTGNAGTTPGTHFLGTSDNQAAGTQGQWPARPAHRAGRH